MPEATLNPTLGIGLGTRPLSKADEAAKKKCSVGSLISTWNIYKNSALLSNHQDPRRVFLPSSILLSPSTRHCMIAVCCKSEWVVFFQRKNILRVKYEILFVIFVSETLSKCVNNKFILAVLNECGNNMLL